MISIDRKLDLVVPLERADGTKIYVHAMPISTPTFEKFYMVLAKTFSAFAENGIVITSAPTVARLTLRHVAENTSRDGSGNWWAGDDGVGGKGGLLEDIVRMANVIDGESVRPLKDAIMSGVLTEEDRDEVLSLLVFFTVASRVPPRSDRENLIRGMASIYNLEVTSLNVTDYQTSLKTPISEDNTGKSGQASSETPLIG